MGKEEKILGEEGDVDIEVKESKGRGIFSFGLREFFLDLGTILFRFGRRMSFVS